jgi:hypothetical protein
MNIDLEVSTENESTASPWWVICDPHQMMSPDCYRVMGMITGPFFSREEAKEVLASRRHHYSDRAVVFCASGCYTKQYDRVYRAAERLLREKNAKPIPTTKPEWVEVGKYFVFNDSLAVNKTPNRDKVFTVTKIDDEKLFYKKSELDTEDYVVSWPDTVNITQVEFVAFEPSDIFYIRSRFIQESVIEENGYIRTLSGVGFNVNQNLEIYFTGVLTQHVYSPEKVVKVVKLKLDGLPLGNPVLVTNK